VEIPYWWQHDKESIMGILHNHRPEAIPYVPLCAPFSYQSEKELNKPYLIGKTKCLSPKNYMDIESIQHFPLH